MSDSITPFSASLNLLLNVNVTPNIPQAGYLPLSVTNDDGSVPTVAAGPGTAVATASVITNTGTNAAAQPYAIGFVPVGLGTSEYTVSADGVTQGTVTVTVADTPVEVLTPGTAVLLPIGTPLPTSF